MPMPRAGARWAAVLLLINAALALAGSPFLTGATRIGAMVAGVADLFLGVGLLSGNRLAVRLVWGRLVVGALLVVGIGVAAHSWLVAVATLPLLAVASVLGGSPGWLRGSLAVVLEMSWLALQSATAYGNLTGTDLLARPVAILLRQISPAAVTVAEGRRSPYRLRLPPDAWHLVAPTPGDEPALDLALSDPRRLGRVEVRALHAPGAGGFDLVKLEREMSRGHAEEATELPAGMFDRARTFRFPGDGKDSPAWVGLFVRGDRAFLVSAEAPPRNFPALSDSLRDIVHSFEYEPPPLPVPPREVVDHVRRATVLVQTARGSGSGVVLGLEGGKAWIVTNAHVVKQVALNGLVLATFTDEPDPSPHEGKLVRRDEQADLALLEVATCQPGVTRLPLRQGPVPGGRAIFAVGFPLGTEIGVAPYPAPTVNTGHVSVERLRSAQMAIDVAVNPGNSGGPVVDAAGAVVGIATTTVLDSEISTIVPSPAVQQFLGTQSWLSIASGEPAEPDLAPPIEERFRTRATEATVFLPGKAGGAAGVVFAPREPVGGELLVLAPAEAVGHAGARAPVVFWPGTPRARTLSAQVLRTGDTSALALLAVPRFEGAPEPLPLGNAETVVETTPVDLFGFLPGDDHHTEPRVLRRSGSLSSRQRDDTGALWTLHVDVGVLRGLLGGPVIGPDGTLQGFFLGHPEDGRNLAVALAAGPIEDLLDGDVKQGLVRMVSDGLGTCVLRVDVELEDPFHRIEQVGLQRQARSRSLEASSALDIAWDPPEAFVGTRSAPVTLETTIRSCPRGALAFRLVLKGRTRQRFGELGLISTRPSSKGPVHGALSGDKPEGLLRAMPAWHPDPGWTRECRPDDLGACMHLCSRERRAGSCYLLGHGYLMRGVVSPEHLMAGCKGGVGQACVELAAVLIRAPERVGARNGLQLLSELLERGCYADYGPACFASAELSRQVTHDRPELALYDRGCHLEDGDSCASLAEERIRKGDRLGGIEYLKRACHTWSPEACRDLARMVDRGEGVIPQHYLALRLYQRACLSGDGSSCARYDELQLIQRASRLKGETRGADTCRSAPGGCREAVDRKR